MDHHEDGQSSDNSGTRSPLQNASEDQLSSSDNGAGVPISTASASSGRQGTTIASSPPQYVTMSEIMSATHGLQKMHLVHQIALDSDFKLNPIAPPENSLYSAVKDVMHRAFWDLLSEELYSNPPVYTRALILLEEVKTILLELLYRKQEQLRNEINIMIDIPFIKQQVENDALDFLGYAKSILNFMGKICAPARDETIQKLKEITDPIEMFKGIFETLTLMRIDDANFNLQFVRSSLGSQTVEYEREQFAEALKVQGGIGSLIATKSWLKRHMEITDSHDPREVVLSAFLELFNWDQSQSWPETLMMDFVRALELQWRLQKCIVAGTVLLVTLSRAGLPLFKQSDAFKGKLVNNVSILLQDMKDDESLKSILPNVAVNVLNMIQQFISQIAESGQVPPSFEVDRAFEQSLSELLVEIHNRDHNVRKIIEQRTFEFIRASCTSSSSAPSQLPPGLTHLRQELLSITASIIRLYKYNTAVFNDYYCQLIDLIKDES